MSTRMLLRPIAKWVAQFKEPKRAFEDSPRTGRPSTITTDQNIEAVERIVMPACCVAYELPIPTTTIYEIMSNHLDMKKVSTRWVPKLLTRINRVDCCQELLQGSEVNPDNYFHCIVTRAMRPVYTITVPSVNKNPGEETPTRLHRTRPAGKTMMVIFWDKCDILLIEYLPSRSTINGAYYASIIEWLRCAIVKKRGGKVSNGVLLLHADAPVHKCNIVQTGFVELNDSACSSDIASSLIIIYPQI